MTQEEYINKIKRFDTVEEYEYDRETNYINHWVSLTKETNEVNYEVEKKYREPLTFVIQSDGNIRWKASRASDTRTIKYSKDNGQTWISIASSIDGNSISVESGNTIQFRGYYESYGTNYYYNCFSGSTCSFSVKGNIMSLINSTNFAALTSLSDKYYTFYNLFKDCTGLTDASELLLPATTLTNYCYYSMFEGCTSLIQAPELPATTLSGSCYNSMFAGCTSLTTAPALPATTLASYCYSEMFYGCTNLTTAPVLPATTLAGSCYANMFQGCTSLTTAPELSATTLAHSCYALMFKGCTSLTTAPALPATTLAESCYSNMFENCSSLVNAPELPATALDNYCYASMFSNCTSLTTAPALPATTLAQTCYYYMFRDCTGLTDAPELPATTLVVDCYRCMFQRCSSLNYIKCLATNISENGCTINWVQGVASTGTFECPASTNWSSKTGTSGIPSGWTRVDAS